MQFKRNSNDFKLFLAVGIVSISVALISGILILVFDCLVLLEIPLLLLIAAVVSFINTYSLSGDKVLFNDETISIISNHNKTVFTIDAVNINKVLLPSPIALKKRLSRNDIIIVVESQKYIISREREVVEYLQTDFANIIVYYDDYSKAIKN